MVSGFLVLATVVASATEFEQGHSAFVNVSRRPPAQRDGCRVSCWKVAG